MYKRELEKMKMRGDYSITDLMHLREKIQKSDSETKDTDIWEIDNMIRSIPDTDRLKREYRKAEAIHKVAVLVKDLIGDRSIRRTAEDTGVAASYITGIMKERYLPSAEILRKLVSPESKPQNGVMLQDLMVAAGYQNEYVEDIGEVLEEMKEQNPQIRDIGPIDDKTFVAVMNALHPDNKGSVNWEEVEEQRRMRRRAFQSERMRFEKMAKGLIFQGLIEKQIVFKMSEEEKVGIRGYRPDVVMTLDNPYIDEWWFDFRYMGTLNDNHASRGVMNARQIMGRYLFVEPNKRRKLSIVLNSVEDFDALKSFKDKLAFRGDLSAILVDMDNYTLIEEVYLSHYEVESNVEFKIIN